jgi:hypothetical protein
MMFERYGHLFDHTAKRVAQTADRTIVVNAAYRFGKPRKQKRHDPLRNGRLDVVEMRGLEPLTLTCEAKTLSNSDRARNRRNSAIRRQDQGVSPAFGVHQRPRFPQVSTAIVVRLS